jgi:Protein of unknown function (DUF1236)
MARSLCYSLIALTLSLAPATVQAQTVITRDPGGALQLTPNQRAVIYRTIVPQRRGRAPIVRERIVVEPAAPPVVNETIVTRPAETYGYDNRDYAYAPAPRVYDERAYAYAPYPRAYDDRAYAYAPYPRAVVTPEADYAYVGGRVPATVRLAPLPQTVVADIPRLRGYRYVRYSNRVLLVDPSTNMIIGEVTE